MNYKRYALLTIGLILLQLAIQLLLNPIADTIALTLTIIILWNTPLERGDTEEEEERDPEPLIGVEWNNTGDLILYWDTDDYT